MVKWIIAGIFALSLLIAWLINMDYLFPNANQLPDTGKMTALQTTINKCTNIAEKAAAHLKETLEFQRLEKIGRQARVMRLCMTDHGYQQSSKWTAYAKPLAKTKAQTENISVDEAYENLRRVHMLLLSPASKAPAYWTPLK